MLRDPEKGTWLHLLQEVITREGKKFLNKDVILLSFFRKLEKRYHKYPINIIIHEICGAGRGVQTSTRSSKRPLHLASLNYVM